MSNGNREMSNDYMLDGVDDNFRRNGLITVRPTVEDILEFKIQTNLFGAEQGRNSGATVDVITKSGTNQFHGSAFELLRNSYFDARSFFNTAGTLQLEYRQNQFGGSMGGPITRALQGLGIEMEEEQRPARAARLPCRRVSPSASAPCATTSWRHRGSCARCRRARWVPCGVHLVPTKVDRTLSAASPVEPFRAAYRTPFGLRVKRRRSANGWRRQTKDALMMYINLSSSTAPAGTGRFG
jgi:hypothetical protein